MTDLAVPSNCPVCKLNIFQTTILREIKDWEDEALAWKWYCQNCSSFFTWDEKTRIVRNIETRFNRGKVDRYIDPKLPDEFDPPGYNHNKHFSK